MTGKHSEIRNELDKESYKWQIFFGKEGDILEHCKSECMRSF